MGYFLVRRDIAQGDDTQVIVVTGVGLLGVIDIFEIADNFDALLLANPQYMVAVLAAGPTLQPANNRATADHGFGKQALAVNLAGGYIGIFNHQEIEFRVLKSIILKLILEYNNNITLN